VKVTLYKNVGSKLKKSKEKSKALFGRVIFLNHEVRGITGEVMLYLHFAVSWVWCLYVISQHTR
jgi:hypothetical protein